MKLCTNCHNEIVSGIRLKNEGPAWTFCSRPCEIQWNKLTAEDQLAAHYEWVREEALANCPHELVS